MKHLLNFLCLAAFFCVCSVFTSCEDGGWQSAFNDTKYVGEWRPVRYATTYNDEVITDEGQLDKEWYLGWLILSKSSFRSATTMVEGNYVAKDDKITFYYEKKNPISFSCGKSYPAFFCFFRDGIDDKFSRASYGYGVSRGNSQIGFVGN